MRQVGASTDDLNLLLAKRFILAFDSGVIVIKHWRIHNYIQKDRYKETKYIEERATLMLDEKGEYTECIQDVSIRDTQVSIGKDKLSKDSLITTTTTDEAPTLSEVYLYFKDVVEDAINEAEKFHAYNANKGWSCLPNWKAAADLWIARIKDHKVGK